MAIAPIDIQTLYTQLDKVSKNVVQQQQGAALQSSMVMDAKMQKEIEHQNVVTETKKDENEMIQFDGFKQQLLSVKPIFAQLAQAFDLENGKDEIKRLEEQSADPNFWNDLSASQKTLKRIKQLKD